MSIFQQIQAYSKVINSYVGLNYYIPPPVFPALSLTITPYRIGKERCKWNVFMYEWEKFQVRNIRHEISFLSDSLEDVAERSKLKRKKSKHKRRSRNHIQQAIWYWKNQGKLPCMVGRCRG